MKVAEERADSIRLELLGATAPDEALVLAMEHGPGSIRHFEVVEPTLQEIFIDAVQAADPGVLEQLLKEGIMPGGKVLTEG